MAEAFKPDLHLHTHASDGRWSPSDVVRNAAQEGMTHIAITDHDTTAGVAEAMAAGPREGIVVLPGIELSCGMGEDVHLLGLGAGSGDAALGALLEAAMATRQARIDEMRGRLRAMGMPVAAEDIQPRGGGFPGRANLADAMVRHGYVATVAEAFEKYLGGGRPAFVPRERPSVTKGILALRGAGRVVSLAHPGRLRMDEGTLSSLLPEWIEAGLGALEAYHPSHSQATCLRYDRLARRHGLLVTGGSDCHGRPGGARIGEHLRYWRESASDLAILMRHIKTTGEA